MEKDDLAIVILFVGFFVALGICPWLLNVHKYVLLVVALLGALIILAGLLLDVYCLINKRSIKALVSFLIASLLVFLVLSWIFASFRSRL